MFITVEAVCSFLMAQERSQVVVRKM